MEQITILNAANEPRGPFTRAEVSAQLRMGECTLSSLAFMEGLTEWTPLRDVLARIDGPTPAPDRSTVPAAAPVRNKLVYSYAATMEAPQHLVYAGFWLRFAAIFIDSFIILIAMSVVFVPLGFIALKAPLVHLGAGPLDTGATSLNPVYTILQVVLAGLGALAKWLYFALQESSAAQATLGKRAMGIRVTDLAGQKITFARATGRFFGKYVSAAILCTGYIMAAFTERKQALHDMLAGTLVVRN